LTEKKEEYKLSLEGTIENLSDRLNGINISKISEGSYSAKVLNINELNRLIDILRSNNILLKEIIPQKNTLEEMFISLIKESEKAPGL
jgi:hypothetical protein